jgi:hypothetical protein
VVLVKHDFRERIRRPGAEFIVGVVNHKSHSQNPHKCISFLLFSLSSLSLLHHGEIPIDNEHTHDNPAEETAFRRYSILYYTIQRELGNTPQTIPLLDRYARQRKRGLLPTLSFFFLLKDSSLYYCLSKITMSFLYTSC